MEGSPQILVLFQKIKKFIDNLANTFSIIQNSQRRRKKFVFFKFSKMIWNICTVLTVEGFLQGFELKENHIIVYFKYSQKKPAIQKIQKISLQGRRIYTEKRSNLKNSTQKGLGIQILSTSKGILCCRDARFYGVGGEILCCVS